MILSIRGCEARPLSAAIVAARAFIGVSVVTLEYFNTGWICILGGFVLALPLALMIDLPGFTKDEVQVTLKDGYLTISAEKGLDKDEQEKDTGRYIRRERYSGACSRSFYVGETVTEEDIKANFQHGILTLDVPKKEPVKPEAKRITIEG